MNWPGLLITAPFASIKRNQLCQACKARGEAAALCTKPTHFIDPSHTADALLVNTAPSAPRRRRLSDGLFKGIVLMTAA